MKKARMKKTLLRLIVILLMGFVVYSIWSNKTEEIIEGDFWRGTWLSEKTKVHGTFTMTLLVEKGILTGYIRIQDSPITKGGSIKGTIKDNNEIEFGLIKDKKGELEYFGKIFKDTMSGTWQIPVIKDFGAWEAKKTYKD